MTQQRVSMNDLELWERTGMLPETAKDLLDERREAVRLKAARDMAVLEVKRLRAELVLAEQERGICEGASKHWQAEYVRLKADRRALTERAVRAGIACADDRVCGEPGPDIEAIAARIIAEHDAQTEGE